MRHIAFTVTLLSLCLAWGAQESPQAIAVPKPEKVVQIAGTGRAGRRSRVRSSTPPGA